MKVGGGDSTLTIGDLVVGGGANRVLFEDGSQLLATDADFTYDAATNTLGVQNVNGIAGQNLGITAVGATTIVFTANGNIAWRVGSTGNLEALSNAVTFSLGSAQDVTLSRAAAGILALTSTFRTGDGAVGAPAWSFTSLTTTGIYKTTNGCTMAVPTTGALIRFATAAVSMQSGVVLGWSSGDPTSVAVDTSLSRASAGVVTINSTFLTGDGAVGAPAWAFTNFSTTGVYAATGPVINFAVGGNFRAQLAATGFRVSVTNATLFLGPSGTDVLLVNDAADILALKRTTTAQTFRVYGTTTGSKYIFLTHDGTDATLDASSGILKLGGTATTIQVPSGATVQWSTDVNLVRDAANVLALKNSTTAQELRVYGTTSGSKYALLKHNGTDATLDASSGKVILGTTATTVSIPTGVALSVDADRGLVFTNQTNQAAAQPATLNNAPAAGDPAFWVPINVNGTNRSFPVW